MFVLMCGAKELLSFAMDLAQAERLWPEALHMIFVERRFV